MGDKIKVVELFAGVGGFRLGLEGWNGKSPSSGYQKKIKTNYEVVWSNQWEPSRKSQEASEIYVKRFGAKNHSNDDINLIKTVNIPNHDLLVGGFPCQDYSVATSLKNSQGLYGKKGVLWWQIYRILEEKGPELPKYLFLENVDRLLVSPAKQKGRDMAVILASLQKLGYIVEWRVINAAEYGMPQRRKRIFLLGYHKSSNIFNHIIKEKEPMKWLLKDGVFADAFPVSKKEGYEMSVFELGQDLKIISDNFNLSKIKSPFQNTGIVINNKVHTIKTIPNYSGRQTTLGDLLIDEKDVPKEFFINIASLEKWKYLKGAKSSIKTNKAVGYQYKYSEGAMIFPDSLDKPSRTIITGEGGPSPSRFKHVIRTKKGLLRRLTPVELERINMFPDNHTIGASDVRRAFIMGNALVTGVIENIGRVLIKKI
jgi:DNA (cytosine-5)-methyltransferase 1